VPLSLVNLCVVAVVNKLALQAFPGPENVWPRAGMLLVANLAVVLVTWLMLAVAGRQERRRREAWPAAQVEELEVGA
jgi:hypothetical protein